MGPDLQRENIRLLRRAYGPHAVPPRSCILSDNISESEVPSTPGGFVGVWKGCYNGNRVHIKTFHTRIRAGLSKQVRC